MRREENETSLNETSLNETIGDQVASTALSVRDEISELCDELADAVERFRGGMRPTVTKTWHRDMRLLVERGATGIAPAPIPPERVRNCIRVLFTVLDKPEGPRGFCWAGVVEAPSGLREKWVKIYEAAQRIRKVAAQDPLAEFRTPDANLAIAAGVDPLAEFRRPAVAR
jgi:hypothetical protein